MLFCIYTREKNTYLQLGRSLERYSKVNIMEITITKAHEIKTTGDWYDYAPPQSCKHWKDGRSAKLLAEYALSENFKQDISKILKECNLRIPKKLYGEPEAITNFPSSGTGRHHDLLIDGDEIIIAIEAKVSELFGNGKTIKNEYEDKSANKQKAVSYLRIYIFALTFQLYYSLF